MIPSPTSGIEVTDRDTSDGPSDDDLITAGSMIAVPSLGVETGDDVRLGVDGPDEVATL